MIALASLSEAIGVLEAAAGALKQAIADHESAGQIAEDILAAAVRAVLGDVVGAPAAAVVVAIGELAFENSAPGSEQNAGPGDGGKIGAGR